MTGEATETQGEQLSEYDFEELVDALKEADRLYALISADMGPSTESALMWHHPLTRFRSRARAKLRRAAYSRYLPEEDGPIEDVEAA